MSRVKAKALSRHLQGFVPCLLAHQKERHHLSGCLSAFLETKKIKGTMEEKVTIIQTSGTSEGTTIKLAPDVAYIEATFEDRLVSRVIVKMKGQ